jgi:hypothetical protein
MGDGILYKYLAYIIFHLEMRTVINFTKRGGRINFNKRGKSYNIFTPGSARLKLFGKYNGNPGQH